MRTQVNGVISTVTQRDTARTAVVAPTTMNIAACRGKNNQSQNKYGDSTRFEPPRGKTNNVVSEQV